MNVGVVKTAAGSVLRKLNVAEQTKSHVAIVSDRVIYRSELHQGCPNPNTVRRGKKNRLVIDRSFVTPDIFRIDLSTIRNDARSKFTPVSF